MSNNLNKITNKKIAILGIGIENIAMLRYLLKNKLDSDFTICDSRDSDKLGGRYDEFQDYSNISWKLGEDFNRGLEDFDVMFRSPGWPIFCPGVQKALAEGVKLESPMRLFFDLCPTNNIIGVTGTKGKGTTSSLIYDVLRKDERDVYIGGNIGEAPFSFFKNLNSDSWVVLELSSFQLEDMNSSPQIAVITNFSEDHLSAADPNNPNHHSSMEEYWTAKSNIFRWQDRSGLLVVSRHLKRKVKTKGKRHTYHKSKIKSSLVGEHNKKNIGAAAEVAKLLNIDNDVLEEAIARFKGLPFRTEFIAEVCGVRYYNDSFATTPESTIIGFEAPLVLLAGGADKGSDFSELACKIKRKVKRVILFSGVGSDKLREELIKVRFDKNSIEEAASMPEAFEKIQANIRPSDTVLMSTACASFGVFKNYKERGELFNEEIKKLSNEI